jgi:hypothetical protein
MEAQDGIFVGGKKIVDHCGSSYYFIRIMGKFGLEGKEHNLVVSLRFSITECLPGRSCNQGIMG